MEYDVWVLRSASAQSGNGWDVELYYGGAYHNTSVFRVHPNRGRAGDGQVLLLPHRGRSVAYAFIVRYS